MNKYNILEYKDNNLLTKVLKYMNLDSEDLADIKCKDLKENINHDILEPIIKRILLAKENNEKVLICGDYDCDGICATTIMYKTLLELKIDCGYYIPNRFNEGYGVNLDRIKQAHSKGYSLIITVDNGVKAFDALKYCKDNNIDIILTDHHEYNEDELICDYFLHPNVINDYYDTLCGAALAYQISKALINENKDLLILAGIATIGDVMPLIKYNRVLVKKCIQYLNEGYSKTIQTLSNDSKEWNSEKIAFQIVPKLNAIGRLADIVNPNNVVTYLLLDDDNLINRQALEIKMVNDKRKELSDTMYEKALTLLDNKSFILIKDESFHEGLNGIVAGKICNEYNIPSICFSYSDGLLKGSARSNGINLVEFFKPIEHLFVSYGGHKFAAGLSIEIESFDELKNYCINNVGNYSDENIIDVIKVDKDELTIDEIDSLKQLEPFGEGFNKPLFLINDTIDYAQSLSNGKHIKYRCGDIEYLYFNHSYNYERDKTGNILNFIGELNINEFRNKKTINMILTDVIK